MFTQQSAAYITQQHVHLHQKVPVDLVLFKLGFEIQVQCMHRFTFWGKAVDLQIWICEIAEKRGLQNGDV